MYIDRNKNIIDNIFDDHSHLFRGCPKMKIVHTTTLKPGNYLSKKRELKIQNW